MKVFGQIQHRLHGDLAVGLAAPRADLFGGDRAPGFVEAGEAAGAQDGGVFEVDVQHHLTLAAGCGCGLGCRPRPGRAGRWARARLPAAMERRTSRDSVEPSRSWWWASAAIAASRSRASARSTSPSMRTRPLTPTSASAMSKCPASAAARRSASVASGSNRALASSISRPSCAGPMLVRERGDLGVHERRRLRGEAQGAVGDEREPPRRQLPGLEPGPAPLQPVAALHRVGQVTPPGLRRPPHRGGELHDRELRDLRAPFAAQRQAGLVPLIDRPHQRLAGVHRRPPRGGLEHLARGVVLEPLLCPCVRQHTGGVVGSGELERVQGRGHRGDQHCHQPPTVQGSRITAVDKRFRAPGCGRKLASSAGCGGFETVAARPPQPPEGRSHTAGGNPLASRLCPRRASTPPTHGPTCALARHSASGLTTYPAEVTSKSRRPPAAVSTSSTSARASRCLRCGGFETVAARPPQPPGVHYLVNQTEHLAAAATPQDRSQPSGGNPIASPPLALAGAVNPPREPQRRHPGLTAPVRARHSASGLTTHRAEAGTA